MMRNVAFASLMLMISACTSAGPPSPSPETASPAATAPVEPSPADTAPAEPSAPSTPTPPPVAPTPIGTVIPLAPAILDPILADAAERAGVGVDQVAVVLAESVVWPDSSMGCPQPGIEYLQVPVDGYRVVVSTSQTTLDYRGRAAGDFRLCPLATDRGPASPSP